MYRLFNNLLYLWCIAILAVILFRPFQSNAWLLAQIGLNESYRVKHLTTHFSRVFLCITVESEGFPTLIEAQWPETYLPMRTMIYPPHRSMHARNDHNDCSRIHQAIWTQVDGLSRLWVMDMGWKNAEVECSPKLLVFDLIRNNAEVLRIDCGKYIQPNDTNLIVVKLGPTTYSCCEVERFIYFVLSDCHHILAYDILEQTWQRRKLISKKYKNVTETFPVKPMDVAFGKEHELLISDVDGCLYSTQNSLLIKDANAIAPQLPGEDDSIEMELLGCLIGPTRSMMVDHVGALFYVVPKFGAVVRCENTKNLTTESSVWLLTDRLLKPQDHCFSGL